MNRIKSGRTTITLVHGVGTDAPPAVQLPRGWEELESLPGKIRLDVFRVQANDLTIVAPTLAARARALMEEIDKCEPGEEDWW